MSILNDEQYEIAIDKYRSRSSDLLERWHAVNVSNGANFLVHTLCFDLPEITAKEDNEIIERVLFERKVLGKDARPNSFQK